MNFDPLASRSRIAWASLFAGVLGLLVLIFRGNYTKGLRLGIVELSTSLSGTFIAAASLLGLIVYARSELRAIHGIRMSRQTGDLLNTTLAMEALGAINRSRFSYELPWAFILLPIYVLAGLAALLPQLNSGAALAYYCLPSPLIAFLLGIHQSRAQDKDAAPTFWIISALSILWSGRLLFLLVRG